MRQFLDGETLATTYTYDSQGNKLTQTDAEGRTTRWEYDALGRVTTRILPLGQRETFTYDAVGNQLTHVDFNGQVTTSDYDNLNRLTRKTYDDGTVETWQYDDASRVTQASQTLNGATEVTTYAYDDRDRLIRETKPDGASITYGYDANGNRTALTVTLASGHDIQVTYTYDALNRLETVTDANGTTTYTYDSVGNRQSVTQANGVTTSYTYDSLNRLTELESTNSSNTVLTRFSYTLDPTGRRTAIEELNGRASRYAYDDLYRLVSESITDPVNGNYSASYAYDKVGNRTASLIDGVQAAYTYDDNDRLLQQGGTTYTYDANGNTLAEAQGGLVTRYSYDARNRMVGSETVSGVTTYAYDIHGIRTAKTHNGVTTTYVVDHNQQYAQVLAEEQNGIATKAYTYGDDLLSQRHNGESSFFLYDGLGSTRALADMSGSVSDEYFYEAFGQILHGAGSTDNSYRFTGEQYDSALHQYYLRARYYDQGVGRFTQMDTWVGNSRDPYSLHKYLYANADPVVFTDPTGYFSMSELGAAFRVHASQITSASANYGRVYSKALWGEVKDFVKDELTEQAFGILGDQIVGRMVQAVENAPILSTDSPQAAGSKAHKELKDIIRRNADEISEKLSAHGVDIFVQAEMYFHKDKSPADFERQKGTIGLDVTVINKRNGKILLGFDLKTGKSGTGTRKGKDYIERHGGAPFIDVFIKRTR